MKEYMKPVIEFVGFKSEAVTSTDVTPTESNDGGL